MNENTNNGQEELDVDALRRKAQQAMRRNTSDAEVSASDDSGLIVEDDQQIAPASYDGPGMIIDKAEVNTSRKKGIKVSEMNDDRKDNIKSYMAEQDEEINAVKQQIKDETGSVPNLKKEKKDQPTMATAPVKDMATNVNILIDKIGIGKVEFTDDEKKKLTFAKKIKVTEVEEQKFKSIKIRQINNVKNARTIIERNFDRTLSSIVAPLSGYVGKMGNCSISELAAIFNLTSVTNADSIREAWTLIYNKLKFSSIGNFDSFNDFIKNTAIDDFEHFIFGILCSSFPEDDELTFNCKTESCKQEFKIKYKNSDLIRTNEASDECKIRLMKTIEASNILENAKVFHQESMLFNANRISISDTDSVLCDIYTPSVYDVITRIYTELDKDKLPVPNKKDDENTFICSLITKIKAFYLMVSDEEDGEPSYLEITSPNDIYDVIHRLDKDEVAKLVTYISNLFTQYYIGYGISKVQCPYCHTNYDAYTVSPSDMLFHRVQL